MTKFYTLLFALIFSFCLSVQAQSSLVLDTIRISGVVVNKKGVGLSAGVFSDTTCSKGTRADEQGRFSMQLAGCQLPVKIIFYLWEYQIREISISQSVSDLRIVMKEKGGITAMRHRWILSLLLLRFAMLSTVYRFP